MRIAAGWAISRQYSTSHGTRTVYWYGPDHEWGATWGHRLDRAYRFETASEALTWVQLQEETLQRTLEPKRLPEMDTEDLPEPVDVPTTGPASITEIVAAHIRDHGLAGRDRRLVDLLIDELRTNPQDFVLRAPRDKKDCTSLRERVYTAARKAGVKVSVRLRDGELHVLRQAV